MAAIHENKSVRSISEKYLCEKQEIAVFESDIVRLALKDKGFEKADMQLLDEIIYMEIFHNEIMWQILRDGIKIGGKDYMLFSATTGQVRNTTVTLMRKDFFEKHQGYLYVGLAIDYINNRGGMNVGKFLSYTALPLSSSILPEKEIDIDRCILVKGLKTTVTDKVKYVDIQKDLNGQHYVYDTPKDYIEKDIKIEHTDGAGMFIPGELPSSCQIRSGFYKGAMFPFDFRLFANTVAHNTVIIDAWKNEVDIEKEDIRYIFTTSQLKMWEMYSSWEAYKKAFKENGLKITVNSYANPAKETVTFAYQYLQTLPYGCDIKKLVEPAKEDLRRLHTDLEYAKEVMGYTPDSETHIDDVSDNELVETVEDTDSVQMDTIEDTRQSGNSLIAEALNIYPQLIYDPYINLKIRKMVQSKRKNYKGGKIPIKGYYSYVAPDMYAFCEYLFCGEKNPKGLVPKNHVYNRYYDEKGTVERVICLRSPHLSKYEYGKRELVKSDDCREWFKYMESDTIVSCHDLLSKTLQMDWDGDEILISDDEELYVLTKELPDEPLYYEMQQADPQQITIEAIYDTLIKGFDNNVIGDSSNAMTKLWNTPDATKENPYPYDDAINVYCAYSNYAIDYPKTGKSLALGEYEELYNRLVPPKNGANQFKQSEIKLPNFFIEAKGKKSKNVAKPTNSVMDRVKQYVAKGTGRLEYKYFKNDNENVFDYRMLMNNEVGRDKKPKFEVNRTDPRYERLYLTMKTRKAKKKRLCREIDKENQKHNTDATETIGRFDTFHYHCVREIKEIFTDDKGIFHKNLAVNYLIDMEYRNPEFATSSKDILWKCFGHIIIENLKKNLHSEITIKFRPRMAYVKGVKGDEELDSIIAEKMKNPSVDITEDDLNFIFNSLQTKKNEKPYSNDGELLYVLYCLYKVAKLHGGLKDGWLHITKKKHVTETNIKSGSGKKKHKKKVIFNMNKIMEIASAKSYKNSFDRLNNAEGIVIEDNAEKSYIRIKIDMPETDSKVLFNVKDVYNSMVYLQAYTDKKKLNQCKVCGRDFIKSSPNQKTCGEKCQAELHKFQVAETNEKNRQAVLEQKKVI